jgi:hypothetical protein
LPRIVVSGAEFEGVGTEPQITAAGLATADVQDERREAETGDQLRQRVQIACTGSLKVQALRSKRIVICSSPHEVRQLGQRRHLFGLEAMGRYVELPKAPTP